MIIATPPHIDCGCVWTMITFRCGTNEMCMIKVKGKAPRNYIHLSRSSHLNLKTKISYWLFFTEAIKQHKSHSVKRFLFSVEHLLYIINEKHYRLCIIFHINGMAQWNAMHWHGLLVMWRIFTSHMHSAFIPCWSNGWSKVFAFQCGALCQQKEKKWNAVPPVSHFPSQV